MIAKPLYPGQSKRLVSVVAYELALDAGNKMEPNQMNGIYSANARHFCCYAQPKWPFGFVSTNTQDEEWPEGFLQTPHLSKGKNYLKQNGTQADRPVSGILNHALYMVPSVLLQVLFRVRKTLN